MKRRDYIATGASLLIAGPVFAGGGLRYKKGLVDEQLAAGKTVFVDFYTDWCTTCRAQQAHIRSLKSANPMYEEILTFVSVDWDKHRSSQLAKRLKIPRRSTLVVLRGDQEIGRIVAGTRKSDIQELMDAGVAAATA